MANMCEKWCVTNMRVKDGVGQRGVTTKEEAEEQDWDEEPGGTDLKTRTPHKDVGKKSTWRKKLT